MADWAAPADLGSSPEQDLLILTDHCRNGRNALNLPFREATVREWGVVERPATDPPAFDTIVVDTGTGGLDQLDAALTRAVPALRRGGAVIVVLGFAGSGSAGRGPRFDGLRWCGLTMVNGHPAAVLQVATPGQGPQVEELLVTANQAVLLTSGGEEAGERIRLREERAREALARFIEDRRLSEDALLRHLSMLAQQLTRERQRPLSAILGGRLRRIARTLRHPRATLGRLRTRFRRHPLRFGRPDPDRPPPPVAHGGTEGGQ